MQFCYCFIFQQWTEAATLYEQGGYYDKAASVYIRGKNWLVFIGKFYCLQKVKRFFKDFMLTLCSYGNRERHYR